MSKDKARAVPAPTAQRVTAPPVAAPATPARAPARPVTEEQVRLCAYLKWERAGRPASDGVQFWLEAERELRAR
jgi:hypothetical protein